MTKVATFGNCQARALAWLLRIGLPDSHVDPVWFSNNRKTGRMESPERIVSELNKADVVVFQPLSHEHGPLSEANLRAALDDSVMLLAFPYMFNHGMAGFCRAATATTDHSYGHIFGEKVVLDRLEAGASGTRVVNEYLRGELPLDVRKRFDFCIAEMARREETIDIPVSSFILDNYQSTKLFLTLNHPSTVLLTEICRQLKELTGLPIDLAALRSCGRENLPDVADCPASPHDLSELGCTYDPDPDWVEVGTKLIWMIAREWKTEQPKVDGRLWHGAAARILGQRRSVATK